MVIQKEEKKKKLIRTKPKQPGWLCWPCPECEYCEDTMYLLKPNLKEVARGLAS